MVKFTFGAIDVKNKVKHSYQRKPGLGRTLGEGNGNPLQYSCLENPMDKGAWWATVRGGRKESDTTERVTHTHTSESTYGTDAPI